MKIRIAFTISLLVLFLVGCSPKYNPEDFIGKTSEEIISQYGSFDCYPCRLAKMVYTEIAAADIQSKKPRRDSLENLKKSCFS